jgi:CO/xanthine dehydrogenase FAD-binding subunit
MTASPPPAQGAPPLRALDARVELRGQDPRLVAESWLRAHGLIPAGGDVR